LSFVISEWSKPQEALADGWDPMYPIEFDPPIPGLGLILDDHDQPPLVIGVVNTCVNFLVQFPFVSFYYVYGQFYVDII